MTSVREPRPPTTTRGSSSRAIRGAEIDDEVRGAAQQVREARAIRLGIAGARGDDLRGERLRVDQAQRRGRGGDLRGAGRVEDDGPAERGQLEQRHRDLAARGGVSRTITAAPSVVDLPAAVEHRGERVAHERVARTPRSTGQPAGSVGRSWPHGLISTG